MTEAEAEEEEGGASINLAEAMVSAAAETEEMPTDGADGKEEEEEAVLLVAPVPQGMRHAATEVSEAARALLLALANPIATAVDAACDGERPTERAVRIAMVGLGLPVSIVQPLAAPLCAALNAGGTTTIGRLLNLAGLVGSG